MESSDKSNGDEALEYFYALAGTACEAQAPHTHGINAAILPTRQRRLLTLKLGFSGCRDSPLSSVPLKYAVPSMLTTGAIHTKSLYDHSHSQGGLHR